MKGSARRFCQLAAVLLALATITGAAGAHALRSHLTADRYEVFQTAVHYQFIHALGLLGLGLLVDRVDVASLRLAGWLLFAGVLLFSGSLYLILAGAPAWVGVLTPIGGLALILAWGLTAWALGSAGRTRTS